MSIVDILLVFVEEGLLVFDFQQEHMTLKALFKLENLRYLIKIVATTALRPIHNLYSL